MRYRIGAAVDEMARVWELELQRREPRARISRAIEATDAATDVVRGIHRSMIRPLGGARRPRGGAHPHPPLAEQGR